MALMMNRLLYNNKINQESQLENRQNGTCKRQYIEKTLIENIGNSVVKKELHKNSHSHLHTFTLLTMLQILYNQILN